MADRISDGIARRFGIFPRTHWCPDTHIFFAQDIRARIKTVMQGTLKIPDCPEGEVPYRHPDCPFARLPGKAVTKILEYVAGSSTVQQFFKKSPSKEWYDVKETTGFKIKKPKDINGVIVEFHFLVDIPVKFGGNGGIIVDIGGLPLGVYYSFHRLTHNGTLWVDLNVPAGVTNQGWEWESNPYHGITLDAPAGAHKHHGRLRLVLRPYGKNFAILPNAPAGMRTLTWVNQGVTEHGPCTGLAQGNEGAAQLPCKPIHDLFDASEFFFRFRDLSDFDMPDDMSTWFRDLRIMFF